tara:strand:+ start:2603 stop:2725 length:123 start_codon:yes stop_codon:yes gene_type:complete
MKTRKKILFIRLVLKNKIIKKSTKLKKKAEIAFKFDELQH